jgi:glucokinase
VTPVTSVTGAVSSPLVPADVRLANLARVVQEMRDAQTLSRSDVALSRSDVARLAGISVATAHRLIFDLAELGLVEEQPVASGGARPGRPPVVYRFRDEAALLAAADVGNETTRLAVTTLSGRVLAAACLPSDRLGRQLAGTLARRIAEMVSQIRARGQLAGGGGQLAGAGIGIASAVDADGVLRAPPIHKRWDGLPLRTSLATRLGCRVAVAQDDHLSPIAESSDEGTFPGASSLLVLEIGRGIGVGMTLRGEPVAGAQQRFGRIAGWPVSGAAGPGRLSGLLPGRTLGECLAVGGLVSQYHAAGGSRDVRDGADLAAAARSGDEAAGAVFGWAAREVADLVGRLHLLCDPEAVVIGGGLARSYDLLEPGLSALPGGLRVARSVLGEQAVVAGAVLVARSLAQSWLGERLART